MRTKLFSLMMSASLIISLSGCGTIGARAMDPNAPPFAGLRADFEAFDSVFKNKEEIEPLWYWLGLPLVSGILLADIPVSLVFDLYCLPADLKSQNKQPENLDIKIEKTVQEDVPSVGQ